MDLNKEIMQIYDEIVKIRRYFHMYPELGLEEVNTSSKIKEILRILKIPYKEVAGTGIVGYIGKSKRKIIALRADMDAIRVNEKNDKPYTSKNNGIMHACGHDGHMAALIGACKILKKIEDKIDGQILIIFQPSEENCKGAKMVLESGLLDDVEEIFGVHIFGDIDCGKISIEVGPRMAASDIFKIHIKGKSGHAAKPHQCIDAGLIAASTVLNLQSIVSRELDPLETAVVTIGHIQAGSQHNIIPGEALVEGTVRSFSYNTSKFIEESIIRIAKDTAMSYGGDANIEYNSFAHPVVDNDEDIVNTAIDGVKKYMKVGKLAKVPKMLLGEDFSVYQEKIKGAFAFVGGKNDELGIIYPNHNERFDIDEKSLIIAMEAHLSYVIETLGINI